MSLMHKVQVTPLIGLPQFDGWSQVVTNDDATLTVALAVGGVNAGNVGRDLVIQIAQARPQTAAELHTLLLDTLHAATTVGSQIAMGACCCIGDVSIFAAYQGSVLLKRGAKSGVVVSAPDSIKVVEGKHTIDDVVVVATSQATSFFGEIQQKLSQGYDIDTIVTSIVPGLHSAQSSALSCMAFITFEEQIPLPEEPPLFEIAVEAVETPKNEPPLPTEPIPDANPVLLRPLEPATEEVMKQAADPPEMIVTQPAQSPPIESLPSHSVELRITSSTSEKISTTLVPILKAIGRFLLTLGRLLIIGLKKTPSLIRTLKNRAQPLYAGGQYVTSLPKQQILKMVVPVLVLIALLIGGLIAWRRWTTAQVQAAEAALVPLEQRFQAAQDKVETQPLEARSEMEKTLDEMIALKNSLVRQPAAARLVDTRHQQLQTTYTELSGRHEVTALPVFFDLQSVQSDLLISKADADATRAALLDTEKKQLVLMDLDDKEQQLISLESISKPTHLSLTPNEAIVLGNGIRKVELDDIDGGLKDIKEEGDNNRDGILVGTFGAYIYVVNPAKRNIYRYAPNDDGYTDPIGWLKPGQSLPYDQLASLAIDGDVWLGTRDANIIKLTQGSEVEFTIVGLPQALSGPLYVYTKENQANLYVLEPNGRRVVIIKKNGEFIREIKSDSLASASSIFADETLGKIFVVNGSLIFEITI